MRCAVIAVWALMLSWVAAGLGCVPAKAESLKPRVIVFVHGLHGDRWSWSGPNNAYWPQMIQTDPHFRMSDVVVAEYPTPTMRGRLSTQQLSEMLWKQLAQQKVWQHREVVIIAHSLGGIVTEEMLLNHPAEAARVRFIVSYATPHQGSFIANMAKTYDSDPLLTDLSSSNDNNFLMNIEQKWRSTPSAARIHRYCAYETQDTAAGEGMGKYLHARARVVNYYSATYGCDTDTPPQAINADHINIIKPANRWADAYTFFARVYHNNPVVEVQETVRDNRIAGLTVSCNGTNTSDDLAVPIALDPSLHEQIVGAEVELSEQQKIRVTEPPVVKKIDPFGVAHVAYGFKGDGRGMLLGCPTGHAALLVHFKVQSETPVKE